MRPRYLIVIFLCFLIWLVFTGQKQQADTLAVGQQLSTNDSLRRYLDYLYELLDNQPETYATRTDSLQKTIWRKPVTEAEKTAWLDFVLLSGYYLLQQGHILASTECYEKALRFCDENNVAYDKIEYIIKPLGNNYVRLGDYDKALALQQAAIDTAIAAKNHNILASLYGTLAITHYWMRNYSSAIQLAGQGLLYVPAAPEYQPFLCNILSEAYISAEQYDSARYYNRVALHYFKSNRIAVDHALWYVASLQIAATLQQKQQQYRQALTDLTRAYEIVAKYFPASRYREKAKLLLEMGKIQVQLHAIPQAKQQLKKALTFMVPRGAGLYPDPLVTGIYYNLARCYKTTTPNDSSTYYYKTAVTNEAYTRQLIVHSPISSGFEADAERRLLYEEAVSYFWNLYENNRNPTVLRELLWIVELSKARNLISTQVRNARINEQQLAANALKIEQLRNYYLQIAQATDSTEALKIEQHIRYLEMQLGIEENRMKRLLTPPDYEYFWKNLTSVLTRNDVYAFFCSSNHTYIIRAGSDTIAAFKYAAAIQDSVQKFVNTYFEQWNFAFDNNPALYYTTAGHLYNLLLPLPRMNKPLLISADGVLHRLPFEALWNSSKTIFLAQEKPVSYVYSLVQYKNMQQASSQKFAITAYNCNQPYANLPALPFSKEETAWLRKHFATRTSDATKTEPSLFINALEKRNVLHIATHAVASDSGKQPWLLFKEPVYLGQLQFIQARTPLVVLTACHSADGENQNGEGLASIGRAFIALGVPGVVASRWLLDDAYAAAIIPEFYKGLQAGLATDSALWKARYQYFSRVQHPSQLNPVLWAGFMHIGFPQHVPLRPATPLIPVWAFALLALVLLLLAYYRSRSRKSTSK